MKHVKPRFLLIAFLLSNVYTAFGQENKFYLVFEYSPSFSGITDAIVNERSKLSHNALFRLFYDTNGNVKPTIGMGILNVGSETFSDVNGQFGIESVKFVNNHRYLHIPLGMKITFSELFILPEIGLGINLSNKNTQFTKFSNGETEKITRDQQLLSGEFNGLTIPVGLSFGADLKLWTRPFSIGLKAFYGLNQVLNNVPRNNHYLGVGVVLAMKL